MVGLMLAVTGDILVADTKADNRVITQMSPVVKSTSAMYTSFSRVN